MQPIQIEISVFDKSMKVTTTMQVEQLGPNVYRASENDFINWDLTLGTEFETRLNGEGHHEVLRILKKSEFITRRFALTPQFKESEYLLLGQEIEKQGGFWQIDVCNIAIINLPKDCPLDIDEIFRTFDFIPTEIFEP
jgi:hypothetical protein